MSVYIRRFPLTSVNGVFELTLPVAAQVLDVGVIPSHGIGPLIREWEPVMYVLVNDAMPLEIRKFIVLSVMEKTDCELGEFIGTYQFKHDDGIFIIGHVFEVIA